MRGERERFLFNNLIATNCQKDENKKNRNKLTEERALNKPIIFPNLTCYSAFTHLSWLGSVIALKHNESKFTFYPPVVCRFYSRADMPLLRMGFRFKKFEENADNIGVV